MSNSVSEIKTDEGGMQITYWAFNKCNVYTCYDLMVVFEQSEFTVFHIFTQYKKKPVYICVKRVLST